MKILISSADVSWLKKADTVFEIFYFQIWQFKMLYKKSDSMKDCIGPKSKL